ncbi:hypothetical protein FQN60_003483 [Etheostoma spectabile]|uniref:Chromo domain-containing protein n=1 Tax=Etheostoma spectabile TaxID=54343 RepID=A0A5J5CUM2_9PERO|nr:hypothetical protein FQN60_003483 [Etheostoma spectabile]
MPTGRDLRQAVKDSVLVPATPHPPPPCLIDGGPVYTVRKLLVVRRRGRGRQYLVDWEGCGPEERSWVSASNILDPVRLRDYHQQHPEEPGPSNVGLRGRGTAFARTQGRGTPGEVPRDPGCTMDPRGRKQG